MLKFLSLLIGVLLIANGSTLSAFSTESMISNNGCNCVIFRLDDVQDQWLQKQQVEIMDLFISKDISLTLGLILDNFGEDTKLLESIKNGADKGLFELALHGLHHIDHSSIDKDTQVSHFLQANNKLKNMAGHNFEVFIPPYNTFNKDTLEALAQTGITVVSGDKVQNNEPVLIMNQSRAQITRSEEHTSELQ